MFESWLLSLYSSDVVMSGFIGAIAGGLISGLITWFAMKSIDNQAKKRWEKEGYLKRQIELEIEIRKYLIKLLSEYLNLADIAGLKDFITEKVDEAYIKKIKIYDDYLNVFFQNYSKLLKFINSSEESAGQNYNKVSALINEYTEFNPKLKNIFHKFWKYSSGIGKTIIYNSTYDFGVGEQQSNAILDEIINSHKADKLNDAINNFVELEEISRLIIEKIKPQLY